MKYFIRKNIPTLLISFTIALSFFMHLNIFNKDITGIHTWRQTQTGWNIRNFYRYDSNIFNPRIASFNNKHDNILRYEFPLMQWGIAMVQKVFGDSNTVLRVSLFIIGVFSLLGLYLLLRSLSFSPLIAGIGVWAFNFSPVFYYYTINPMPDNFALFAGIWYLYFFMKSTEKESLKYVFLAGFFVMLASLTKLPFIIFGGATFIHILLQLLSIKKTNYQHILKQVVIYMFFLMPVFLWYKWVIPGWSGNGVLTGMIDNPISIEETMKILEYDATIMFPYILLSPASWLFILISIFLFFKKKLFKKRIIIFLLASFSLVLLYFVFEFSMINTVHDYYLLPFLPFLFIAITYGMKKTWNFNVLGQIITIVALVAMPVYAYLLNQKSWTVAAGGFNPDLEKYKTELQKAIPNAEKCIILNDNSINAFAYFIDKQGYIFYNDYLPAGWINDLALNHNVKYMYSDSRIVDENEDVKKRIDYLILEAGSIRVFKLKKGVMPEK